MNEFSLDYAGGRKNDIRPPDPSLVRVALLRAFRDLLGDALNVTLANARDAKGLPGRMTVPASYLL